MLLQAAHAICPGAKKTLRIGDNKTGAFCSLTTDVIINAAVQQAQEVAADFVDFPPQHVPRRYLARGCNFALSGMLHSSHATWAQALLKRLRLKVLECVQPFVGFCIYDVYVAISLPGMASLGHSPAYSGGQLCTLSAECILYLQGWSLTGKSPFRHLIYPMPENGGLGAHLTLDLANQAKFGPDVEWVDSIDYTVDPGRAETFYSKIRHYWPGLPDGALQPSYSGEPREPITL